jgi:uncharacterized protein YaeQ
MEKKTTSIKIDPELWKRAKIYSIEKDIELGKLIESLLEKKLTKS